ncbi:superoxide dismutase family protein [Virgibacillus flavescens]|uniref:superoxide dismutase family protein n=1 Tax=Virgibacillus flavescens TaxID=1611422 RepID=UPI003D329440
MYYYDPNYHMHYQDRQMVNWAFAEVKGSELAPDLHGYVVFTNVPYGTEITVEVTGLPPYRPAQGGQSPIGPHGFHIHQHADCGSTAKPDPFEEAGGHWNPTNQPHGNHAGDFPVLFSNDGYARMTFFTNQFSVKDVVGKSVMIHQNPDDYRTQPSGDSGKRLGCGAIQPWQ